MVDTMRITGLDGLVEDTVEAYNVKIEYPDTLDLYLIGTNIGVKTNSGIPLNNVESGR